MVGLFTGVVEKDLQFLEDAGNLDWRIHPYTLYALRIRPFVRALFSTIWVGSGLF